MSNRPQAARPTTTTTPAPATATGTALSRRVLKIAASVLEDKAQLDPAVSTADIEELRALVAELRARAEAAA